MKKEIVSVVFSYIILSCTPQLVQAQEACENNPEYMTAAEIIDELYAEEVNPEIYQCAKSSAMILTGEKTPANYYGTLLIGTYDSPDVYFHANVSVPVGNTSVQASIGSSYTMVLPFTSVPNDSTTARNKEALNMLYQTVQQAKAETANMSDTEKAIYLVSFVQARFAKREPETGRVATCLQNGFADCDGFSGLYYLTSMNCGLHVRVCLGTFYDEEYAWNMVELNGVWNLVDPILEIYFLTDSEMNQHGYVITK